FYSDRYTPIDAGGNVRAFPIDRSVGSETGGQAAPVAIVATLTQERGVKQRLVERSPQAAVLALLQNACGADTRPDFALSVARATTARALSVEGHGGTAEQSAPTLIERLARLPHPTHAATGAPSPAVQFAALVLELENELIQLARTFTMAGVDAVLLNGDDVRPALAQRFAFAFSALIEMPRAQVPRALIAMERNGWKQFDGDQRARYFRRGVPVLIKPRPADQRHSGGARDGLERGRFGFLEPATNVAKPIEPAVAVPFDPGAPLRTGVYGAAGRLAAETIAAYHTRRLRTREREFHGLAIQYGPGVHAFEAATTALADTVLAQLPPGPGVRFVEIGTGTGAVALSVASQRPDVAVLATDVTSMALGWTARNRRRLGIANVSLAQGSLLAPVPAGWRGKVSVVAANPPLALPVNAIELQGRMGWPVGTATGPGADGLGLVRALVRDARQVLAPGGCVVLHLLAGQGAWIAPYLLELGYEADVPTPATDQYMLPIVARWRGAAVTP
ncbi:MAG: methyltransferase, partial [Solirubrobacteraceae bacterium]